MNQKFYIAIFVALACFTGCFSAGAAEKEKFSKEAQAEAEARKEIIMAEIKALGEHPWAGDYYEGDGKGVNRYLTLAPESGFVFRWRGCLGLYDLNYGIAGQEEDTIQLLFTFKNEPEEGFEGVDSEFVPVPWGAHVFLVPPEEMIEFCNDVNGSSVISYLRRRNDGEKDLRRWHLRRNLPGLPDVPEEYKPYLRPQDDPVKAEIISLGDTVNYPGKYVSKKKTPVTINKGSDAGLLPEMKLRVTRWGTDPNIKWWKIRGNLTLTDVEETFSEGVLSQDMDDEDPAIGWQLSTGSRWEDDDEDEDEDDEPDDEDDDYDDEFDDESF